MNAKENLNPSKKSVAAKKPAVKKAPVKKQTATAKKYETATQLDNAGIAPDAIAPVYEAGFREKFLASLAKPVPVKFKRRGPTQHGLIEAAIANLNADFRNKAARLLESSGKFTEITYPQGFSALQDGDMTKINKTILATKIGFQSIQDFVLSFPHVLGDTEDIIRVNTMVDGKTGVFAELQMNNKSMTLIDQVSTGALVLDLFENGFYTAHDSEDIVAYSEMNIPKFRAAISFDRKGNLKTSAVSVAVRWAADNQVIADFLEVIKRHVTVTGSEDAGTYDTITDLSSTGLVITSESLQGALEADPTFYPWMEGEDPAAYINEFLESDANVLVLFGPPGGGKTTLIRTAVKRLGLKALGTANQDLFRSTGFVSACGTRMSGKGEGGRYDVLVAEDAEILCGRREPIEGKDGRIPAPNTVMSSLLNAVDGVSKENSFKLIVTTNNESLKEFDPALLRPGRCFDTMYLGHLTAQEGMNIRAKLGMPNKVLSKGRYMLAEILKMDTTKSELIDGHAIVSPRYSRKKAV